MTYGVELRNRNEIFLSIVHLRGTWGHITTSQIPVVTLQTSAQNLIDSNKILQD